ncbi:MAG: hypothetical protein JWP08_380, partial [Bryobacterales bacterium]|nr:hypothetical protein [Bryobacterales bacterium]
MMNDAHFPGQPLTAVREKAEGAAGAIYVIFVVSLAAILAVLTVFCQGFRGGDGGDALVGLGLLLLPVFVDPATALISSFHRAFGRPSSIPRSDHLAVEKYLNETLVAIPVLVNQANYGSFRRLLEARYLQSGKCGLRFCLLTDFD